MAKAITDGEVAYAPIDMAKLVQKQHHDPFCRQIRRGINESQHISLKPSENELLQRFI